MGSFSCVSFCLPPNQRVHRLPPFWLAFFPSACLVHSTWPSQANLTSCVPGAAFIELYFVLSSLFASRAYYAFGFLALTAAVVALTTATVTILFTYFILCAEDYRCVCLIAFP